MRLRAWANVRSELRTGGWTLAYAHWQMGTCKCVLADGRWQVSSGEMRHGKDGHPQIGDGERPMARAYGCGAPQPIGQRTFAMYRRHAPCASAHGDMSTGKWARAHGTHGQTTKGHGGGTIRGQRAGAGKLVRVKWALTHGPWLGYVANLHGKRHMVKIHGKGK